MENLFVVTGGSSGIGQSIALSLANSASVIVCGRDETKLNAMKDRSPRIQTFSGDLRTTKACAELIARIQSQKLPLKGLINNAGAYDPGLFADTSDDVWIKQFETNLLSAVRLTRGLFDSLKKAAPSSVLNISSTLALKPVPGTSSYSAIKAAMVNWTECLALEWAPFKIRVNCICPGLVDTPIHQFHGLDENAPARVQAHKLTPLGRMGTPDEIAWAAEFLLSEKSAWTTGSILSVDGGIRL